MDNGLNFRFGHPNEPEKKQTTAVEFVTAVLALIGTLGALASQKDQHPFVWWGGVSICFSVLLLVVKDQLVKPFRKVKLHRKDNAFVAAQRSQLTELYTRFAKSIEYNNGKSLQSILRSIANSNLGLLNDMVPMPTIDAWARCFGEDLSFPTRDAEHFVARCREFTHIISAFNREYVVLAHYRLGRIPLQQHDIIVLDEFRDEWIAYLRQVEAWAEKINDYAGRRFGAAEYRHLATANFERVPSFRKTEAAAK